VEVGSELTMPLMWKLYLIHFYVSLLAFWHCVRKGGQKRDCCYLGQHTSAGTPRGFRGKWSLQACSWHRLTDFGFSGRICLQSASYRSN